MTSYYVIDNICRVFKTMKGGRMPQKGIQAHLCRDNRVDIAALAWGRKNEAYTQRVS